MGQFRSLCALSLLLSACSSQFALENANRLSGPEPQLDSQDIAKFADHQKSVAQSLALAAGLEGKPASGDPRWQDVVDTGMHYVDTVCDDYINAIFKYERARDSAKSGVALTGAATLAAMGILQASAEAVALVGTAFGLTSGLIDTVSTAVVYNVRASAVETAVRKSQDAYRQGLEGRTYTTQAAALGAVRGYLALCLPATIENTIGRAVATAAIEPTKGPASNIAPRLSINRDVGPPYRDASDPLPPVVPQPPPDGVRNPMSRAEKFLTSREGQRIQRALCIAPDGDFGPSTRQAIALFRQRSGATPMTGGLGVLEVQDLLKAGDCDRALYANAYERFVYGPPQRVQKLRDQLGAILGRTIPPQGTAGGFDEPLRQAIKDFQRREGLEETGAMTPELLQRLAL